MWKCYLTIVFECVVAVSVSDCACVSLPATVWCIPFLSV